MGKLEQLLAKIPDEAIAVYMLIAWTLEPTNNLLFIGMGLSCFLALKKTLYPIIVPMFERVGDNERINLTYAKKFNKKEDNVEVRKIEYLDGGEKNCPEDKFFKFVKKGPSNLWCSEGLMVHKDGNVITPILKQNADTEFLTEADISGQVMGMKKREERIKSKDAITMLQKAIPMTLLLLTVCIVIWGISEITQTVEVELPARIAEGIAQGLDGVVDLMKEGVQEANRTIQDPPGI